MDELISVIVPIYNVEEYLDKCVKTICEQTYKNLEIILVDDGSPDGCGAMCDQYAKQDCRIKVIHKENGGLSDARNAGIDIATGKYLVFVDSDDYIHQDMIGKLYYALKENQGDLAVCGYQEVTEKQPGDVTRKMQGEMEVIVGDEAKKRHVFGPDFVAFTVAWNKLYLRSMFAEERYPKGKIHEDEFLTYKMVDQAEKIVYLKENYYFYVQREQSIMQMGFSEKRLYRLEAYQEKLEYFAKRQKWDYFQEHLLGMRCLLLQYVDEIKADGGFKLSILKPYHKIFCNLWRKYRKYYEEGTKRKFSNGLFCVSPGLYYKFFW